MIRIFFSLSKGNLLESNIPSVDYGAPKRPDFMEPIAFARRRNWSLGWYYLNVISFQYCLAVYLKATFI